MKQKKQSRTSLLHLARSRFTQRSSSYAIIAVLLLMGIVYVIPIWSIRMGGVQFTEPLKVYIWVNKITGGTDVDLYTINDFNHYVGMRKIQPDSIRELTYMPYLLAYMLAGALFTLWRRRVYLVVLGLLNLCLVGFAGIWDFWRWLHSFGTELDTTAPLYSKDVDFQPPMFACKDILNVTTCSWPHVGAIFLLASMLLLGYILYNEYQSAKNNG